MMISMERRIISERRASTLQVVDEENCGK